MHKEHLVKQNTNAKLVHYSHKHNSPTLTKQILERAVLPQNLGISYKSSGLMSQSVHERCGKFAEGHKLFISKRRELYVFIIKKLECEKILSTQ